MDGARASVVVDDHDLDSLGLIEAPSQLLAFT